MNEKRSPLPAVFLFTSAGSQSGFKGGATHLTRMADALAGLGHNAVAQWVDAEVKAALADSKDGFKKLEVALAAEEPGAKDDKDAKEAIAWAEKHAALEEARMIKKAAEACEAEGTCPAPLKTDDGTLAHA